MQKITVAIIGFGYRGQYLSKLISKIDEFEIIAIADILTDNLEVDSNIYFGGENAVDNMFNQKDPDIVFIVTEWDSHHKYALKAINRGHNVALEVKGALFENEYESLINAAQINNVKIYPLENTVFMRNVMSVSEMCKNGLFGKILWSRGAYRHDLRKIMFSEKKMTWRTKYYYEKNRDIYPTHSIGPLLYIMNQIESIKFKSLTSFSTASKGISSLHPNEECIKMGDVITTIITTEAGAQIVLHHDTTLPRPKSLPYEIQGTKGTWCNEPGKVYIENVSCYEKWEDEEKYIEDYMHPLWTNYGKLAMDIDSHHDGMDYIMLMAIVEDIKAISVYPITANEMARWANISLWSEESLKLEKTILF